MTVMHHAIENCTGFNLRAATRSLTRRYDELMAGTGLLSTQFSMLNFIERRKDCGMADVAEWMDMDISTVTRNLAPLVSARYVAIRPSRHDKRRKEIRLTPNGKQIVQKTRPLWVQAQDEIVRKIGAKRYKELLETLRAIRS